ncbi:cytoplasmic protein [Ephemerocybe angulata]|uniref:Cytoplasmic protein n=1 Tax=Ephemerocybe angulata TaxID=980116 RepID=A0A8H6I9T7_9AGAR|nr:cytoplasmic protein [Tulosesus angulatus]
MVFTQIFKAIFQIFCGPGESKPEHKPQQQHGQQQQQQHQQQQQQQQFPGTYPPQQGGQVRPPHGTQQKPPQQKPPSGSRPHKYTNDNEVNSANEFYKGLRSRANEEGDKMAKAFASSSDAYNRGDHAGAKEFSAQGKVHQRKMEEFNKEASDWIFRENNLDSQPGEIDLHGLYVKEALARTEQAIEEAKRNGKTEVHLIVGKGLHSTSGAKVKPAIEGLMKKHQLDAELDPQNAGVLIVHLNRGRSRMGADEISRRLERSDESCAIM